MRRSILLSLLAAALLSSCGPAAINLGGEHGVHGGRPGDPVRHVRCGREPAVPCDPRHEKRAGRGLDRNNRRGPLRREGPPGCHQEARHIRDQIDGRFMPPHRPRPSPGGDLSLQKRRRHQAGARPFRFPGREADRYRGPLRRVLFRRRRPRVQETAARGACGGSRSLYPWRSTRRTRASWSSALRPTACTRPATAGRRRGR